MNTKFLSFVFSLAIASTSCVNQDTSEPTTVDTPQEQIRSQDQPDQSQQVSDVIDQIVPSNDPSSEKDNGADQTQQLIVVGGDGQITCSDVTLTSILVSWTKATGGAGTAEELEYQLYYSISDNIGTVSLAETNGTPAQQFESDVEAVSLISLLPNTIYYLNVIVRDSSNSKVSYQSQSQRTHGGVWEHPSSLIDNISPDSHESQTSRVAMSGDGDAIITWEQSDGSDYQMFISEYRDGHWTHPLNVADNVSVGGHNTLYSQSAMSGDGDAIMVWWQSDGSNSQLFKSEYRDGTWTHPGSLTDNISPDSQSIFEPQVAMSGNGDAIIVWRQSDGSKSQIFKSELRNGSWDHPANLDDNISPNNQNAYAPDVAMDSNSNAIIVWYQTDGTNNRIFKSEYRSGGWIHPADINDSISPAGQSAGLAKVAMAENGDAIIVWRQSDGSHLQTFKSEYQSNTWLHPTGLNDNVSFGSQGGLGPDVAMSDTGGVIITWYSSDGTNSRIFKGERREGVWSLPNSFEDSISLHVPGASHPDAAMSDNGDAIVTWHANSRVYFSEYRGGSWKHPGSVAESISPLGGGSVYPVVGMSGSGEAIIAWRQSDGSSNQIFKSEYRLLQ